jgi:hypothetical protein
VSNIITDWREQLVAYLAEQFPQAKVESGVRPPAPSRDKDLIAVFWPGMGEAANVNFANPTMTVRYWVRDPKMIPRREPRDDSALEAAGIALMQALQPVQATLDPQRRFYFRVVSIVPDREEFGVEAQLLAWTVNPATIA